MIFETAILKTEYLPPVSTFWAAINSDKVVLEVCENYQKKSTRNRARILGVNSIEVLSIPLNKGKNNKMSIGDVSISYEDNWQSKHLHSIRSAYGNSPYFEYYFESVSDIIMGQHTSLLNKNVKLLEFFIEALSLDILINTTEEYVKSYGENDCDLRNVKFIDPNIANYTPKSTIRYLKKSMVLFQVFLFWIC